jgi:hypothetical protein
MDQEVEHRLCRALIEGAAEGLAEVAKINDLALDVVVVIATSTVGIATHVMANTSSLGTLPDEAIRALSEEISIVVAHFLRQCLNRTTRSNDEKGSSWKKDNN